MQALARGAKRSIASPVVAMVAATLFDPSLVLAQQATQTTTHDETTPGASTGYQIEFGETDDWLQLTTGEWLRGDLRWMRAKGFEAGDLVKFYSEQLNDVTFSWSDVARVHSPKVKSYAFRAKKKRISGRATITATEVIIETEDGTKTFPRSELVSIAEGEARERSWWSTQLSLGFSANAGNSNQGSLNTSWQIQRADGRTLGALGYNGAFVWADGSLNTNRHLVDFDVNLLFWKTFYVIPATGQILYDKFQNLKVRATPGAGVGVHVFDKKKTRNKHTNSFEWDLQSGLGYQYTRFFSTATGVANPQNDGFVMFRTFWRFKFLNDDVEIELDWRTNLVYTTIGNTNHNGTATITIQITDKIDFVPSFLFLRTEQPQPESDGTIPKKNDYQLVVSLALELG